MPNLESEWKLSPGNTMFTIQNKHVQILIQPLVGNLGISEVDPSEMSDNLVPMSNERSKQILLCVKTAIDKALAGEAFKLDIKPWPSKK